jgi:hypothetical protein
VRVLAEGADAESARQLVDHYARRITED